MAATRPRRAQLKPKDEAAYFSSLCKDKEGFDVKYINAFKGRGVYSCRHFQKGDFLVEYRGELIDKKEHENRERVYNNALKVFMFEFRFSGKQLCIDAAREDKFLGRLFNDNHLNPNSKMSTITVDGKLHLCLFAKRDISPGEEIMYNYGNSDWPWRCENSAETDPQYCDVTMISGSLNDKIQQWTPEEEQCQPKRLVSGVVDDAASKNCKHDLVSSAVPTLEKCAKCCGPFASFKWIGVRCKICSCFWHKSCYEKNMKTDLELPPLISVEPSSSEEDQDNEYVPDSYSDSDSSGENSSRLSKYVHTKHLSSIRVPIIESTSNILQSKHHREDPLAEDAVTAAQHEKTCRKAKQLTEEDQAKDKRDNCEDISVMGSTGAGEGQRGPKGWRAQSERRRCCVREGAPEEERSPLRRRLVHGVKVPKDRDGLELILVR